MSSPTPDGTRGLRVRDHAAQFAQVDFFVRAAAAAGAFGLVALILALAHGDRGGLATGGLLFVYCAGALACRQVATRGHFERAAVAIAALTLLLTVSLGLIHPGIHAALVLAALFPAAIAIQLTRGPTQRAVLLLSWLATIAVGWAADHVMPSTLGPDAVQQPFRLVAIAATSGVFLMLLVKHATRLVDRIDEVRTGQAAAATATAALVAAHERLSVTLASIVEAVVVTGADGHVTLMNSPAERVLGAELRGRPIVDVCCFEDARGQVIDPVRNALGEGLVLQSDEPLTLVRHDGRRFPVCASAAPIRAEAGGILGAVIVLRDVSERRQLEEELREAQKLDAIGRLARGIAHDFNNQLTSILGYAELLICTFDETDQRRQDMEEIRKAAERAALVTEQLLAFSRRQALQPRLVNVADVVAQSARLIDRMLTGNIKVDTAVDVDLHPIVIDPHQLGHVLLNLALSARDAMMEGGRLSIRAANMSVTESGDTSAPYGLKPGPWVRLVVEDTGTAIPAERLPTLLEPFATQTRTSPGSLALAVVHGIVIHSGGRIHARSETGCGTTFTMYFPGVVEKPDVSVGRGRPVSGHESVLLVEKDAAVRTLLATTLERQGYAVTAVPGADEAVAAMPAVLHALIVDLALADGKGEQLARNIVERLPGLPIVYFSNRAESAAVSGPELPDGRSLQKPFNPGHLLVALREALDRERPELVRRSGASHS
jgi:two-component system cell cycle sensor histidine kinase/response regulator CckA